jgi:hypothetical protein
MRIMRISMFAVLLSAVAVLAMAGLGITDEAKPVPGQFNPAPMENNSVAPAPMEGHSIPPAGY